MEMTIPLILLVIFMLVDMKTAIVFAILWLLAGYPSVVEIQMWAQGLING